MLALSEFWGDTEEDIFSLLTSSTRYAKLQLVPVERLCFSNVLYAMREALWTEDPTTPEEYPYMIWFRDELVKFLADVAPYDLRLLADYDIAYDFHAVTASRFCGDINLKEYVAAHYTREELARITAMLEDD
jgi:hypothetical protein